MAKKLKAAVLGRKADNMDESDDEDDSPATDTHASSGREDGQAAPRARTVTGSSTTRTSPRNYNTFGWESDVERDTPVT